MCPNINLSKMIIWKENIITQMVQAVGGRGVTAQVIV